ncbi:hypothetical protein FS837_011699 [Tulasnella sp. UAMH 9824]|nr:hypothetical protein FS837_011699 [Tulasnella sp. UAMH 9824]
MKSPQSPGVSPVEEESLVRPGYIIFNRQLPKPIPGTLEKTGEVARGGFGDVYRGLWVRPNTNPVPVIIKCVRPPDDAGDEKFKVVKLHFMELKEVKRETLIWSMVKHPNVLPLIGYQIVDEVPMLVSPWCKNGNLDVCTKDHPELMRSDKLELLRGAARGLLHLHSLSPPIFHGDLKPQNIIVQDNLEAVLCDFGISRVILDEEEHSGWTTSTACGGTKGFQSKEILDEGPPTTAADVYAFAGAILATMSGQPPFWKKVVTATAIAIALGKTAEQKDHPKLPETDSLWVLMRECWHSEPYSRLRKADLLKRLEDEISQR